MRFHANIILLTVMAGAACACDSRESDPFASEADPIGLAKAVAAGGNETCIITEASTLQCWGANEHGQLGNGAVEAIGYAHAVVGLTGNVSAVSIGSSHACAVTSAGALKCWGSNETGQLGDGTTVDSAVPIDVVGLSEHVRTVSAGADTTCAVLDSGSVRCWGDGLAPVPVPMTAFSSDAAKVSVGTSHVCIVSTAGGARCLGRNDSGELGDGTTTSSFDGAVDVVGLGTDVVATSNSFGFTCALTAGGDVKCWGYGRDGQLGDGAWSNSAVPVNVLRVARASTVDTGTFMACALSADGRVKCWGQNGVGALGAGTVGTATVPVEVVGVSGATALAVGNQHACAIVGAGHLMCWGARGSGQFGPNARDTEPPGLAVDVRIGERSRND